MADPLSASTLVKILRAEGCKVVEVRDWRDHNRNHRGTWAPINGVIVHHTVTSGTAGSVRLCYEGHSSLPGPLCHGVIAKDGTIHLVSSGRANHAGGGDPAVLDAVRREDYGDTPPGPNRGNFNGTDGNAHFYGFECINLGDGRDPWPEKQLEAIERACAAIARHYGWSAKSVIGHLEWSNDKIDPRGFGMPWMRRRIQQRIDHPNATSDTAQQGEQDMPQLVNIGETKWKTLRPGDWDSIEFHREWVDERDDHYDPSGSQFVRGACRFTGVLHLRFDALPAGEQVQVRLGRVDGKGKFVHMHPIHEVQGTSGDSFASVPITGDLDKGFGMRAQLYHWQPEPIRFRAYLEALVWEGN